MFEFFLHSIVIRATFSLICDLHNLLIYLQGIYSISSLLLFIKALEILPCPLEAPDKCLLREGLYIWNFQDLRFAR